MLAGFVNGGLMDAGLLAAATGVVSAAVTGGFALVLRRMDLRKFNAEIERICADTDKVEAETHDLVSARLIRELDRLSASNDSLGQIIITQREEIDTLRRQVIEYAAREMAHATENLALRNRVAELESVGGKPILTQALTAAFPVEIPHTPSEFDNDGSTGSPE